MKYLTFAVPCYNSESYMKRCVNSLLKGGSRVEIILIDDGSTDGTGAIADQYQADYPEIVRVIHKENGGHGSGIMAGLAAAEGLYFKVVDSDDWADPASIETVLDLIQTLQNRNEQIDLLVCNYVYEREGECPHSINYHGIFPRERTFTWADCRHFDITRYLMMHAMFYRTELVRACDLNIPQHTFYVDNVYTYVPLPAVKTLYYCDTDFYRYYIGRADQSVNEAVLIKRIDQHLKVTNLILNAHNLPGIKKNQPKLYRYMLNFNSVMVLIPAVFLSIDGSPEALGKLKTLWSTLKSNHPELYSHIRWRSLAGLFAYQSRHIRAVTVCLYRIVRKIYKFN